MYVDSYFVMILANFNNLYGKLGEWYRKVVECLITMDYFFEVNKNA